MPDRPNDLRRQRELAAEQLARLDREIAKESEALSQPATSAEGPTVISSPSAPPAHPEQAQRVEGEGPAATIATTPNLTPEAEADAEAILQQYRVEPDAMHSDVKKGCFLYFFLALAAVAIVVTALYFFFQRGR